MVVRPLEASFPNPTSVTTVAVALTMTTLNITHVKGRSALRVSERIVWTLSRLKLSQSIIHNPQNHADSVTVNSTEMTVILIT